MNTWEKIGLWLMLYALVITIAVLSYDLYLYGHGYETISGHVWDHLRNWRIGGYQLAEFPTRAIFLPGGVGLQAVGLFIHLIAGLLDS